MPGILQNFRDGLAQLTNRQKIQLGIALVATFGLVWGVVQYSNRIRYGVLFTRLDDGDAATVIEALKAKNVPYQMRRGGRVIDVPTGQVDELRMELAAEGLPRGGGVGFEIFDKPSFGLSDFIQNVNFRRALERELGRSIQSLGSVESARVHLALPPESVFVDEKSEASASVILGLRGTAVLPNDRVRAIAHLVASGVEGLDPARVSVIDSQGRMLTNGEGDSGDEMLSTTQHEMKSVMESRIQTILLAILEPVVGTGRVRARATVELETARVQRVEEKYDPDVAVVRSEQKNKSKSRGSGPGGVPGTASNLPGTGPGGVTAGDQEETQTVTTNFEINKSVSTIAEPRGRVLRQSVAVVVDHGMTADPDDPSGEKKVVRPRTSDEMRQITDLVRAAVGIDDIRGDVLIVENVPFDETTVAMDTAEGLDWVGLVIPILRYLALPLGVLLIIVMVIRPGLAALRALHPQRAPTGTGLPPTVAEMQARMGAGGAEFQGEGSVLRQKLIEAAGQDPAAAALVVRSWLKNRTGE